MEKEEIVKVADVRKLLSLVPVNGLRDASLNMKLTIKNLKSKNREDYIEPIIQALLANQVAYKKEKIDCTSFWNECHQAGIPYKWTNPFVAGSPHEIASIKQDLTKKVDAYLKDLDTTKIVSICAGKASSAFSQAERSAYQSRWRCRYGKPEYGYTHMRRLFADIANPGTIDNKLYKQREQFALEMEEHIFQYLISLKKRGTLSSTVEIPFHGDEGKKNTGASFGPQWQVFVYLAIKIR